MNKSFLQIVFGILFFSFFGNAFSQDGISVNNGKLFFNSFEGQKQTQELLISNPNDTEVTLQAFLLDWKRDSFGVKNYAEAASLPTSCAEWIKMDSPNITVPPKGKATVAVTMDVPADYSPESGVRNAMLFLKQLKNSVPPKSDAKGVSSNIQLVFQLGIHLYYTHPSLTGKEMIINDLTFLKDDKKLFVELENEGETLLEAFMQFEFTNMKTGEEIKLFERSLSANFMPGDVRRFDFELPENIAPGEYSVTSIIDIGADQDLLLGVLEIKL